MSTQTKFNYGQSVMSLALDTSCCRNDCTHIRTILSDCYTGANPKSCLNRNGLVVKSLSRIAWGMVKSPKRELQTEGIKLLQGE